MVLGISKRRQEARPLMDSAALEDVVVRDRRGEDLRLGALWSRQPALLVFLRHYG